MKTLRELITHALTEYLLHDCESYSDYIHGFTDPCARHAEIKRGLSRANDTILFALYNRAVRDADIIPCHVDQDGKYCDILIAGRIYGGIVEDGSIHT